MMHVSLLLYRKPKMGRGNVRVLIRTEMGQKILGYSKSTLYTRQKEMLMTVQKTSKLPMRFIKQVDGIHGSSTKQGRTRNS